MSPVVYAPASPAVEWIGAEYRTIRFPVEGAVSFRNDFGDPRSGGRTHAGNDIFGRKGQRLVATRDGTIVRMARDSSISGNYLVLRDAAGWEYLYIHLNNDTPSVDGTYTDDNANLPEHAFAPGIAVGARVTAGQFLGYLGDSGNAESTPPHLHFEIHRPNGSVLNPWTSLRLADSLPGGTRCGALSNPAPPAGEPPERGYWIVGPDGGVFSFGSVQFHGSTGALTLNRPIVGMASTPTGDGYWLVADDGGVFAFGDARFFGSTGAISLNRPIVGMASTPTGDGYWLVADDGGVFTFGDAGFFGSTGALALNRPVVTMAASPTGRGYWLAASDGGIFTFGDAGFFGSTGGLVLQAPVTSMASTPAGDGYWLAAIDGGVFAFGDARYAGSVPGTGRCRWATIVDLTPTPTGLGYYEAGSDGTVTALGDARNEGDAGSANLRVEAVGMTAPPEEPAPVMPTTTTTAPEAQP